MDIEFARQQMVDQQVRGWDVIDHQVLNVMRQIPRETFMPEDWRDCAFVDRGLPLADGQITFSPKLEGRFLQALQLTGNEVCLEIGTGCGYLTACLAALSQRVISLEQSASLAATASETLSASQIHNATVEHTSAPAGLPDQSFDVVVAGGSVRHHLASLEQKLVIGGRAVVVVDEGVVMSAQRITRISNDHWLRESLFETFLPPLIGFGPEPAFTF
ncbi:MAG: protein-L-isoaspartate O-methyltransferase [Pseudomonadota bacterium]